MGPKPVWIEPDPKKEKYRVQVPNVRSWAVGISRPLVEIVDVTDLEETVLDPKQTPPEVKVKPVVGGEAEAVLTLDEFRREYPLSRSKLMLARDLYSDIERLGWRPGCHWSTFEESLELVSRYVDERVRPKGSSVKLDIGIYQWMQQARNFLETAIQNAPADAETVPLFDKPPILRSGDVPEFKWTGVLAKGKKTHWTNAPCHTDLEAGFADFLDAAKDVDRYLKNERFGFSVTYYENNRARQYFPDFIVVAAEGASAVNWIIETKGEIRPNTMLKKEAADLWCERMSRAGQKSGDTFSFVSRFLRRLKSRGLKPSPS